MTRVIPFCNNRNIKSVVDISKPVQVYKNIRHNVFSVRQGGIVRAHVRNLILTDCTFKVSEKGRARVLQSGVKNVHAFVCGRVLLKKLSLGHKWQFGITYNPKIAGYFMDPYDHKVSSAEAVIFSYQNSVSDVYGVGLK